MKIKVALFVNGWNGENIDSFIEGFNKCFNNDEADLFVFTSYSITVSSTVMHDAEDSIYSLPDISFFDAVIIFGSGIKSESVITDIIERCKDADVPVVLQGIDSDEVTSVTVDSYIGMKDLCNHLIEDHNVKNVTYIAGAADNPDSNHRMEVLKEALEEHGYCFGEENIYYANWEAIHIKGYLDEKYSDGKSELPDAFVCANDQMAMFVVLFLEQLGYKIPDDIIVTGFDNLSDGKLCYPSLATVYQNYIEQGYECAKLVSELINNIKIVKKKIIPCAAIPAESCGCINCNGETELRKRIGRMWWDERYINDRVKRREFLFDKCFTSNEKYEDIHKSMNDDFLVSTDLVTEDFHIYLNPQYKELKYMHIPEEGYQNLCFSPVMDTICAKTNGSIYNDDTFDAKKLFLGYNGTGKAKIYIFKSIVINTFVAGYMVLTYSQGAFKRNEYFEFKESVNDTLIKFQRHIDNYNKTIRIQEQANEFLKQTVEALVTAVDAKDSYTNGHSNRVAKYAREIAREAGMTKEECNDVYLAGLLHDVGKIGIDDRIINKKGKLTDEEFSAIKLHPTFGGQILSKIVMSHSLGVGAYYHHERYDGKGYPKNLEGKNIPRIARIIAVADAYDAMTSKRSYRDVIPQVHVREELVKGIGTQFDPVYAGIMIHFLDMDEEYTMQEKQTEEVFGTERSYEFYEYKTKVSPGIRITDRPVSVKIQYKSLKNDGYPTLMFYDSADAKLYLNNQNAPEEMNFAVYSSIDMNGTVCSDYVRNVVRNSTGKDYVKIESDKTYVADIFMVKQEDHLLVRITTDEQTDEFTFALHDESRYVYLALTGKFCTLDILDISISSEAVEKEYIPRIAEKITYIDGPIGDMPNIQIDGWLSKRSEIVKLEHDINLSFHTMSLPSSNRIWHCPIIVLFTSDDGMIGGTNFKELAFIRLNGELWCENPDIINEPIVAKRDSFNSWYDWKQNNKNGVKCEIKISKNDNRIILQSENSGLEIRNTTTLPSEISDIYCYLTGDQCALTNIKIDKL